MSSRCSNFCATCIGFMILEATSYNKRYSGLHQLQVLDITGYQSTELQASGLFVVAHRRERIRAVLRTRPHGSLRSRQFQPLGATFSQQGTNIAFRVQLLSNLSSTTSKGSGPTLTPPEKGYSRTPIVKSTEEMINANAATIRVCTSVFSKPNR